MTYSPAGNTKIGDAPFSSRSGRTPRVGSSRAGKMRQTRPVLIGWLNSRPNRALTVSEAWPGCTWACGCDGITRGAGASVGPGATAPVAGANCVVEGATGAWSWACPLACPVQDKAMAAAINGGPMSICRPHLALMARSCRPESRRIQAGQTGPKRLRTRHFSGQQKHRPGRLSRLEVAVGDRCVLQRVGVADVDLQRTAAHQVEQLGGGRAHRRAVADIAAHAGTRDGQ